MQITKTFVAAFASTLAVLAVADEIPSAAAEAYYRTHFEKKPQGAYEWAERGLVFAKVCIPHKPGMDADELTETRKVLREWMATKASSKRVDPPLPYGKDLMRKLCRKYEPSLEYNATWQLPASDSCALTYEVGKMRVVVTVVRSEDLTKAIPAAFYEPVSEKVWAAGWRQIVARHYVRQNDQAFMWRLGALDCCEAASATEARFPDWTTDDEVKAAHGKFFKTARARWSSLDTPVRDEYEGFWKEFVKYLTDSKRARDFKTVAFSVARAKPVTEFLPGVMSVVCETNRTVSCSTNVIEKPEITTHAGRMVQTSDSMLLPIMVASNTVLSVTEESNASIVHEVETVTIIRTTDRVMRKVSTTYAGTPRFEELFLSGGYLPNVQRPRTALGNVGAQAFSAEMAPEDREACILSALRENPSDKELWNYYGILLKNKRELFGAISCFRNALRLDRTFDYALTNLALCYDNLGKKELACATALLAGAVTDKAWCIERVESILNKK